MPYIDQGAPVLVTGATGYVAGWIIKQLVEKGVHVHATIRDISDRDHYAHLTKIGETGPGKIEFFEADLLQPGSFAAAMEHCQLVFHTASPFRLNVKDPQTELVDPALEGTRNVLNQATEGRSVRRVILTSSIAAIAGDNADLENTDTGYFTEKNWNTTSSLTHQPYNYSKTLAEREAWKIAENQDRWRLVSINPALVIGPSLSGETGSESFRIIKSFADGSFEMGIPEYGISLVDVREVANAHCAAGYEHEAYGRYIVSAKNSNFTEVAKILKDNFGERFRFPKRVLPKFLVWLAGPLVDPTLTRKAVSRNVGLPMRVENGRSIQDLGVAYRPISDSLVEMFQQLVEAGKIRPVES